MLDNNNLKDLLDKAGSTPYTKDIRGANPLALAYVGDTIHDLFIRTYLISNTDCSVHMLHTKAIKFVRCREQAEMALRLMPELTEKESAVFRRGRNAKSGTVPKNADVSDYHNATGFEAVLGYLYLNGENDRLIELLNKCLSIYLQNTEHTEE